MKKVLIMSVLKKFSRVSGFKLNLSKSELFPINEAAQRLFYQNVLSIVGRVLQTLRCGRDMIYS